MPVKCRGNMVNGERRFIVANGLRLEQIWASATNKDEEQVAKKRRQLLNTQQQTLVMRIIIYFEVSIYKYKNLHSEMERWPAVTDTTSQLLAFPRHS